MKAITTLLLISLSLYVNAQSESSPTQERFCTFIIQDLDTKTTAVKIDQEMRQMTGMVMSRTDINTKRYYAIFNESTFDYNWFVTHFQTKYGYAITCYDGGTQGVDRPNFSTYQTCNE